MKWYALTSGIVAHVHFHVTLTSDYTISRAQCETYSIIVVVAFNVSHVPLRMSHFIIYNTTHEIKYHKPKILPVRYFIINNSRGYKLLIIMSLSLSENSLIVNVIHFLRAMMTVCCTVGIL